MKTRSPSEPHRERSRSLPDSPIRPRQALRSVSLALALLLVWTGSYVYLPSSDRVSVQVGEPSPRNIMAPRRLVYVSEIKTEEARSAAAALVGDIYTGPNLAIADEQLTRLQDTLARLEVLRNDGLVDASADRLAQARGVADLGLDDPQWTSLLEADADSWQAIGAEALRVLDLVMHDDIREGQAAAKAQQAYRLVRRDLSATERDLVIRIATAFVVPNNFLDIEQTAMSRQNARRLVEPVQWTIRAGESVVREGEIVSPLALEKLGVLGLLEEPPRWDDLIGALVLTTCLVVAVAVYVYRAQPVLLLRPRRQLLLALTLMVAGATARMSIPGHVLLPYLFPAASFCMLVAVLLNLELAVFTAAILSVLVGLNASGSMELVAYVLVGGVIGALAISQIDQLSAFVRAAAYVALSNAGIVLAFQMSNHMHDALGLVQLLTAALSNGVLSASLAFVAFLVIGRLFGITTFVQLMELARPTHPLFRQLLLEAPGTYHHSIVVSNMAERAAQAIGADPLLVRVGSYYHDIGKIRRPYFFAENQNDGDNPHDKLDPKTSAEIIIAHTTDGWPWHANTACLTGFVTLSPSTTARPGQLLLPSGHAPDRRRRRRRHLLPLLPGPDHRAKRRPSSCWPTASRPPCAPSVRPARRIPPPSPTRSSASASPAASSMRPISPCGTWTRSARPFRPARGLSPAHRLSRNRVAFGSHRCRAFPDPGNAQRPRGDHTVKPGPNPNLLVSIRCALRGCGTSCARRGTLASIWPPASS